MDSSDGEWVDLIKEFTSSVGHITGRALNVETIIHDRSAVIEQELESLRAKVEELSNEVNMNPLDLKGRKSDILVTSVRLCETRTINKSLSSTF